MSHPLEDSTVVNAKVNIIVECECGYGLVVEKQRLKDEGDYHGSNEYATTLTVNSCPMCIEEKDLEIGKLKETTRQLKLRIPVGLNLG